MNNKITRYEGNIKVINGLIGIIIFVSTIFGVFVYSKEYNDVVKEILDRSFILEISYLTTIIIIGVLILVILCIFRGIYKQNLNYLTQIDNKNNKILRLKESQGSLTSSYIGNDSKEKILDVIDGMMSNNSDIIAIQMYECIECKHNRYITYEVKPTPYFKVQDGHQVNLIHEKYSIHQSLVKEYNDIKQKYDNGDNESIILYIKKLTDNLIENSKEHNLKITDQIVNELSLLMLTMQNYLGQLSFKFESLDEDFIKKIDDYKRTGFLKGILNDNYCKFIHSGNSYKGQRVYVTKCLPIENRNHMFVIVLNSEVIKREKLGDYLDDIGKKFYDFLSDKTKLVYNEYNK